MKKVATILLLISGFLLAGQLSAQVDSKTNQKPATEQKKDQNTQPGGYTKSGKTITAPSSSVKTSQENPGMGKEKPPVSGSTIYGRTGEIMATVDKDGMIRDAQGTVLGQYTDNGEYLGPAGEKIGTIKDGAIRNKEGKEAARISKEGKVSNAKGKFLGTIYDDGTIRNSKGSRLGSAPGVNKNIAAMVFFINKKKQSGERRPKEQGQPGFEAKPIKK